MRIINVLFLLTLCFLSACAKNTIKIGTVTIRQTTNSITLSQGDYTITIPQSGVMCSTHINIITADPTDQGGLRPVNWGRPLCKSDFVLFPLFDEKPTCLGVMIDIVGCQITRHHLFLDTASNRRLELPGMIAPVWIMGKDHHVGFKTFNYLSVASLGDKQRLKTIYSLVDGAFVPNNAAKLAEVKISYDKISFNAQDTIELCKTNWVAMDREVGDKLIDAVYYGTLLGKQDEVNHLLNMVAPELRKEIKDFILLIPTNAPDVKNQVADKLAAFEHRGNIFIKDQAGKVTRLTSSGKNRKPLISPDGKKLVFIRKSNQKAELSMGAEEDWIRAGHSIFADQIWMIDLTTRKEQILVDSISFISDLCFTLDSLRLYFMEDIWTTASALQVVFLDTLKKKLVCAAHSIEVIQSGEYRGHLVVMQHKYFVGGGSYDWYWLMTPEGEEVGPICPEGGDWKTKI